MTNEENRQIFPFGVRVITSNRIIYQGQLQLPPPVFPPTPIPLETQFIFVKLNCPPEFITDAGYRVTINPFLFGEDDVVKINLNEVVFGPSADCLADLTDETPETAGK